MARVVCSGVSDAKLVASIEVPASHHGMERPATKNSVMLLPARRENHSPTTTFITRNTATTAQSRIATIAQLAIMSTTSADHEKSRAP